MNTRPACNGSSAKGADKTKDGRCAEVLSFARVTEPGFVFNRVWI